MQKTLFLEEIRSEFKQTLSLLSPEDQERFQYKIEFGIFSDVGINALIDLEIRRFSHDLREMRNLIPEAPQRGSSMDMVDY